MRHHYIPQFLLRYWSELSIDECIEVFRLDLPGVPSLRRVTKGVAYEKDLYALSVEQLGDMEKHAVETHFLRHVDNLAALALAKLHGDGLKSLSNEERSDWARFLMSLRLRQPRMLSDIRIGGAKDFANKLSEKPEEYLALAQEEDPPTLLEWTEKNYPGLVENYAMTFFHELVDNPKIGNKLLEMKWWLWDFSRTKHTLLLSDNPCIFVGGIDDPNILIALPISPRRAFMATQSEEVAEKMRDQDPNKLVVRLNESSLNQARVRVYCTDKSPKRFIENRVNLRMCNSN